MYDYDGELITIVIDDPNAAYTKSGVKHYVMHGKKLIEMGVPAGVPVADFAYLKEHFGAYEWVEPDKDQMALPIKEDEIEAEAEIEDEPVPEAGAEDDTFEIEVNEDELEKPQHLGFGRYEYKGERYASKKALPKEALKLLP